jgi:xanthine dehydrogenase YagS FAD-binding subunit
VKQFAYTRPDSAGEALTLAHDATTRYLAGGTNLVDLMKLGVEQPGLLVDVTHSVDADVTETDDGGLRIGAGARNSDLAAHLEVRRRYPVLAQALVSGASGQLRNLATVGGNLLQRTRCAYFQDVTKPCNKRDPGSGCPARQGEHHNLAILGASEHCVATHPSDMAVAMAALDAVVVAETTDGPRRYPIDEFYRLPGDEPQHDTTLAPGALITAVELPSMPSNSRYRKVRERASYAFAIASVAAVLDVAEGRVDDVRLAYGAVAHKPWRARTAEDAIRGQEPSEETFRAALDAEFATATPLRDNGYKIELCSAIGVRTLLELS